MFEQGFVRVTQSTTTNAIDTKTGFSDHGAITSFADANHFVASSLD